MSTSIRTVEEVGSPALTRGCRGATEGPLKTLIPVFIDVETFMNIAAGISLECQTLRQYIANSYLLSLAIAIGDGDIVYLKTTKKGKFDEQALEVIEYLKKLADDPAYVFVAHNAAFDIRVLRFMLGFNHPKNVWCTLEGAMGAWPEFTGGFGLYNLSHNLGFEEQNKKLDLDLSADYTPTELEEYNKRDVAALRELYYAEAARLPTLEQQVALLTHNVRQFHFCVSQERLSALQIELDSAAAEAERTVERLVHAESDDVIFTDDDIRNIFNRDDADNPGALRSIRGSRLRKILGDRLGSMPSCTSLKKLSPVWQAKNPLGTEVLRSTSRANKMISHGRGAKKLVNVDEVDVELGYMRAHTGRFSSPSQGKGLNLHNIPKRDYAIAKPIRKTFSLPPDKCLVRGDLANVEYRVEGWLTNSTTVFNMFDELRGGNIYNDPYCLSWKSMTLMSIVKTDPIRQVAKSAVLGLGFCMSPAGYAVVLMQVCSDASSGVSEITLLKMCNDLNWDSPLDQIEHIIEKCGCSHTIARASYHIHRLFNAAHPEYASTAEWLVRAVMSVAMAGLRDGAAERALDRMYLSESAPDRNKIGLFVDRDGAGPLSVRVACGPWVPTVCWRAPAMRFNKHAKDSRSRLSILKASGFDKTVSKQLAIENVTQAAARNALCHGILQLAHEFGWHNILHIHDEIMIICDKNQVAVLAARDALLRVFGPKSNHPMTWAVLIKPDEVSVTSSMWEDDLDLQPPTEKNKFKGFDRWRKIEQGTPDCLDNLP